MFLWSVSVDRNLPVYLNLSCSHLRFSQAKRCMWRATVPRHRARLSNATAFSCAVVGGRPCALDKSSDTSAPHNPDQTSDNFKLQPHELQPRRIAQAVVLALPRFDTFSCGFCMQWVRALSLHQARNLALIVFENYLDPLGHSTSRPSPARPGQYPHPRKYGLRCKFLCRAGPGRAGPGRPGLCYGLRGPDNFQTLYRQIWLRGS